MSQPFYQINIKIEQNVNCIIKKVLNSEKAKTIGNCYFILGGQLKKSNGNLR